MRILMRSFDKPTLTFLQTDSRGRVGERSTLGSKRFCVPESASEAIDLVHPGTGADGGPRLEFQNARLAGTWGDR